MFTTYADNLKRNDKCKICNFGSKINHLGISDQVNLAIHRAEQLKKINEVHNLTVTSSVIRKHQLSLYYQNVPGLRTKTEDLYNNITIL